ncbi:hypothetical protein J3456_17695 [Sulfitobacter sp. NFXS29]|uniref:hypothetical protein n=1 Tax=Sulfitobacter sp. NFXS29 TaxID=2818438 RepID=UPI0032DE86FB
MTSETNEALKTESSQITSLQWQKLRDIGRNRRTICGLAVREEGLQRPLSGEKPGALTPMHRNFPSQNSSAMCGDILK